MVALEDNEKFFQLSLFTKIFHPCSRNKVFYIYHKGPHLIVTKRITVRQVIQSVLSDSGNTQAYSYPGAQPVVLGPQMSVA